MGQTEAVNFLKLPELLLAQKSLGFGDKMLFALLLRYASWHERIYPSMGRLAQDLGVSRWRILDRVQRLVRHRLVDVRSPGKNNQDNKSNEYILSRDNPLLKESEYDVLAPTFLLTQVPDGVFWVAGVIYTSAGERGRVTLSYQEIADRVGRSKSMARDGVKHLVDQRYIGKSGCRGSSQVFWFFPFSLSS